MVDKAVSYVCVCVLYLISFEEIRTIEVLHIDLAGS